LTIKQDIAKVIQMAQNGSGWNAITHELNLSQGSISNILRVEKIRNHKKSNSFKIS